MRISVSRGQILIFACTVALSARSGKNQDLTPSPRARTLVDITVALRREAHTADSDSGVFWGRRHEQRADTGQRPE